MAHGEESQELPPDDFAELPTMRAAMASLETEDAVRLAAYAAACGDLQSRNNTGTGTFFLLPGDLAQGYSGSLVSAGKHVWLTDTRLEAVRAVDADLADALLRFRDVVG